MHGYRPGTYGASFADVYDDWYGAISDVDATVAALSGLAGGGLVVELGVGTGRIALPLAAGGITVVGIDASPDMLARLTAKPDGGRVATAVADMAALPLAPACAELVFSAFNTFFNLPDADAQRRCLEGVAAVLAPGGRMVVEGFVPPVEGMPDGGVSVRDVTLDTAVLTVTRHEADDQVVRGQHIEIGEEGIRMRPWMLRYLTPTQLDDLAVAAGFELESRAADWSDGAYADGESESHVSVYRLRARR